MAAKKGWVDAWFGATKRTRVVGQGGFEVSTHMCGYDGINVPREEYNKLMEDANNLRYCLVFSFHDSVSERMCPTSYQTYFYLIRSVKGSVDFKINGELIHTEDDGPDKNRPKGRSVTLERLRGKIASYIPLYLHIIDMDYLQYHRYGTGPTYRYKMIFAWFIKMRETVDSIEPINMEEFMGFMISQENESMREPSTQKRIEMIKSEIAKLEAELKKLQDKT